MGVNVPQHPLYELCSIRGLSHISSDTSFSLSLPPMFSPASLFLTLVVAGAAVHASPATSCPSERPNHLCCRSLGPFSDNEYVWENICGITGVDANVSTAAGCSPVASCLSGVIATCCQTVIGCPASGGVDGPIGLDCVQVEN